MKKFLLFLLVVLLGVGGFWFYQKLTKNTPPEILLSDKFVNNKIEIEEGSFFDINSLVKVKDEETADLAFNVRGKVDVNKPGIYELKIIVKDKKLEVIKTVEVEVLKKKEELPPIVSKPFKPEIDKNTKVAKTRIEVIRNQNVLVVYHKDNPIKTILVSNGLNNATPLGTFKVIQKYVWRQMFDGTYAQYATRFKGPFLFHSVPYFKKDKSTLETKEYNKLGNHASAGCIRMSVEDAKWIYDNIPMQTTVKIYDGKLPKGIKKPEGRKIDVDSPNAGWDITDPDKKNPWHKE